MAIGANVKVDPQVDVKMRVFRNETQTWETITVPNSILKQLKEYFTNRQENK